MKVKGMGHDMPRAAWPQLIDGIVANAERAAADRARQANSAQAAGTGS
jgi:hypothetical protein